MFIYLIPWLIDYFFIPKRDDLGISLLELNNTVDNLGDITMIVSFILSIFLVYLVSKQEKQFGGNFLYILFYGLFILIHFFLLGEIYHSLRSIINSKNAELERVEQAIITRKRIETKHHKGGGRGGAYSHTMYFIHYHTNEGRESHVVYGGSNWEKFNEGDSVELSYYKGMLYDWYDFVKME